MPSPALALALLAAALVLAGCGDHADKPRKQQTLKLLPDTPPPPPPPPKPEDKPPPKPENKPRPPDAPKPADVPPQPQVLKTDEAPGSGPGGGLTTGPVTQDYTGQKVGQSSVIGGSPVESGTERLAANAFGNLASRALNEFLVRDKGVKLRDYKVRVQLWLTPTGGLQRAELAGSTGDAQTDEALRAALNRFPGTDNPPPAKLPQPIRVLVSNRLLG